ncbi:MAG: TetR/AcrR family transcriptional regulator [Candidatus Latescibacterota bacterium]|nr:MAG: TetR/AcrR family transcriptional regulator [Candidatus Latescibacterota bacterium]
MGTAERREREKEQRRNDIIDAAEAVFFSKGIANSTMDEIADVSELSKGTLYLYFKNKEDLYLAIILRGLAILQAKFEETLKAHESGIEKTEAIGRAFFEFAKTHPDYFQAMLYFESADLPYDDESGYAAECLSQSNHTFEICARAVQAGIDDGTIRPDLDPMKTAMTLYGVSVGLLQIVSTKGQMIRECHNLNPDELIEYFFELIGNTLRTQIDE